MGSVATISMSYRSLLSPRVAFHPTTLPPRTSNCAAITKNTRGEKWEKVGNWTRVEKRGRVLGCRVHPCRYWHRRTRKMK
eukprot:2365454-Pyramimonas_sp.AAC.1